MPAVNDVGEPCAGEPHARFDGRGLETEPTVATVVKKNRSMGNQRRQRLHDLPSHNATGQPPTLPPGLCSEACRDSRSAL